MKFLVLLVSMLATWGYANATNWDEATLELGDSIKKARTLNLQIDLSKSIIMGLDSADFINYYAVEKGGKEDAALLLLKRFKNTLAGTIRQKSKKTILYPYRKKSAEFTVLVKVTDITDHAGLNGEIYIIKGGDASKQGVVSTIKRDFKISNGRWNTFENLLYEAAEELGKKLCKIISQPVPIPYNYNEQ